MTMTVKYQCDVFIRSTYVVNAKSAEAAKDKAEDLFNDEFNYIGIDQAPEDGWVFDGIFYALTAQEVCDGRRGRAQEG